MSANYEHDQDRLINSAAHALQTATSVATQLLMARQKPLKVEVNSSKIRTAHQDAEDVVKAIDRGTSKEEILKSIRAGDVYQRIAKTGGDANKYEQLIFQRAEIDRALKLMPSSPTQQKNIKKKL